MAQKSKTMHQIRQILTLTHQGKGVREVARITKFSKNTVKTYLSRVRRYSCDIGELLAKTDEELQQYVMQDKSKALYTDERYQFIQSKMSYYFEELCKTGVTKQLLWQEYKGEHLDGYGYTQFCNYIQIEEKKRGVVMHFTHKPGEEMQVDFAGDTMRIVCPNTGLVTTCQILVCVLPYSNMTFAIALSSQKQEAYIEGIGKALEYFGGVPMSIKSDNLKSAVQKANRYEPKFTEAMEYLGKHYNTTILATRVAKPRDKASVEKGVDLTYKNIYAPLRDREFHSLEEMNMAILEKLNAFNDRKMQQKPYSRREIFLQEEATKLATLPTEKYQIKHAVEATAQKNYHILLGEDKKYYSVPYSYVGKVVKVIYNYSTVEIYHHHTRIALHKRDRSYQSYITNATHMPTAHKTYTEQKGWNKEDFLKQAQNIGNNTYDVVLKILDCKQFVEQSFNSCLGIIRLGRKYGKDRLENACKRALKGKSINYKTIENILSTSQDKLEEQSNESSQSYIPDHAQVRGSEAYK